MFNGQVIKLEKNKVLRFLKIFPLSFHMVYFDVLKAIY